MRIWWRNFEERTNTAYTGQCDITGVWIGEAEVNSAGVLTGQFKSAPTQISGAITGPTDGSAFSTALVFPATFTIDPAKEYIISYGWISGSGQQHRAQGFGWVTGSSLNAGQTTVGVTLTPSTLIGLNTWVEINGPSSRIAWLGDSHSAGGASTLAVYDSPVNRLAWANGAVPINLGAGGSTFGEWSTESEYKWQRLITNNVSADGWVYQLGQNDIYGLGTDLETCKTQSLAVMAIGRKILGPNMYLATIYPRNLAGMEAQNAVRIAYNDWLRTLPGRAVGIYDLAEAVTDSTGNVLDSRYVTVDNIHLGTAGNARVAGAVVHNIGKKGR
jgi:lysophospholipase L1-like esterase